MQPGQRLELEIAPDQQQKMQAIIRLRKGRVVAEEPLQLGRRLLLVEKK